jgi:hypothetical protein
MLALGDGHKDARLIQSHGALRSADQSAREIIPNANQYWK